MILFFQRRIKTHFKTSREQTPKGKIVLHVPEQIKFL